MIGFDDQKTAAFCISALTTVNIPRQELGKRAAQGLMESNAEPRSKRKPKPAITAHTA